MQTLHKAAQAVARKAPLAITNMAQFRDACLSAARMFGWDGKPSVTTYYGDDNRTVVVCSAERRRELIEQRQRLLEAESQGKVIELNGERDGEAVGRKTAAAALVTLPAPETHSNANVGAVDGIATHDQSPVVQKDPLILKMESIARAESWKSEENHAGSFGPHPEEIY